ncbi:hypothetical protein FB45DRAFT_1024460 [Roridomyces roridus]|uniref:BHLH domain-containing protein n=1 Tax=Roridomyces roridus TaxID=1738132 RepID=A0AAD7C104_9AGAR|nr:hypothetical protein FB45DRAFT_1024460 [Roridomyces roridus]
MSPPSDDGYSPISSRRSSTDGEDDKSAAARRASHNAVERQRRDKLNARIHELASLLPNLAGVRRPSRIAITKSSIAHIHSSRRHRMMAAYELRALYAENAALRDEINGWRQQAGVTGVVEPPRGEAFTIVYTGADPEISELDAGEDDEYDDRLQGAVPFARAYPSHLPRLLSPLPDYGVSPISSASASSASSSDFPPPYAYDYPTPPSSGVGLYAPGPYYTANAPTFDTTEAPSQTIICPTPASTFSAQHLGMLKSEEWAT